jgi:predicted lipid-binding transport protein (Tim44 family)
VSKTIVHKNVTVNKTVNNNGNSRNNDNDGGGNSGGGGMGFLGTAAAMTTGVVAGNLLTSALMGDHRNAGYAPAGGYASTPAGYPVAGQPVAPAMAGATEGSYVTDGKGGYIPAEQYTQSQQPALVVQATPVKEDKPFDWSWLFKFLAGIASGVIIYMILKALLTRWNNYMERKREVAKMIEEEGNLHIFKHIFAQVQMSYASGANIELTHMVSPELYRDILTKKSETQDNGLTNVVKDINVINLVTTGSWETNGVKFQEVKIRASMIDYVIDEEDRIHHGSMTEPDVFSEYWTFSSPSKGVWVLESIKG